MYLFHIFAHHTIMRYGFKRKHFPCLLIFRTESSIMRFKIYKRGKVHKIRLFHLLLIVFVLLAYQSNTLHFEHLLEKNDTCHVCISSEQTDSLLHEVSYIADTYIAENSTVQQKISRPNTRKITQKPIRKTVDLTGLHYFSVASISLGYFSHAPPSFLS